MLMQSKVRYTPFLMIWGIGIYFLVSVSISKNFHYRSNGSFGMFSNQNLRVIKLHLLYDNKENYVPVPFPKKGIWHEIDNLNHHVHLDPSESNIKKLIVELSKIRWKSDISLDVISGHEIVSPLYPNDEINKNYKLISLKKISFSINVLGFSLDKGLYLHEISSFSRIIQ